MDQQDLPPQDTLDEQDQAQRDGSAPGEDQASQNDQIQQPNQDDQNDQGPWDTTTPNRDNQSLLRPPGMLAGMGRMLLETGPVAMPLRGIGRAFQAMEHRDYRYIWFGALFSNIGMWIQTVAMQWMIKSIAPDASALWLGRDAVCQQLPTVLLLPFGGLLADRIDRRWILLAGNIFLAILSLALAELYWHDRMTVWHLLGASVLLGAWRAALIPANQSLLPSLVSKDNLPNAVALNSMQFNLSRSIGPAVGGLALASLGAGWSFGINSLSYLAIIAAILLISTPPALKRKHEGVIAALAGGAGYLRQRRDLLLLLCVVFMAGVAAAPLRFMLPVVVQEMYGDTASQFTQLLVSFGVGAVVGAGLLAIRSHKHAAPWRGFYTLAAFGVCEMLLSFNVSFHVAMLLVFFCGMSMIGSLNRLFAALIGSIPNQVRGRVASFYVLSLSLGFPVGSLIAGHLANTYGIATIMFWYGAGLVGVLTMAGLVIWKYNVVFEDHTDVEDEDSLIVNSDAARK